MYLPSHFETPDLASLHQLILAHPLGALITHGERGLDANHLPFELDAGSGEQGVLRAHVARNNPLWQEASNGDEVLVIFKAADAYISPAGIRASKCITSRCRPGITAWYTPTAEFVSTMMRASFAVCWRT